MGTPFLAGGNHILWAWATVISGIPKAFLIQICASLILLPMLTNCPLPILKTDVFNQKSSTPHTDWMRNTLYVEYVRKIHTETCCYGEMRSLPLTPNVFSAWMDWRKQTGDTWPWRIPPVQLNELEYKRRNNQLI